MATALHRIGSAIDQVIGLFSPRAGLLRQHQRKALARAYEAAAPRDRWKPRRAGASPNADHLGDASIIRNKARFLVQNVPYLAAALEDGMVAYTIGTGIIPRATGKGAVRLNAAYADWIKVCDADGKLDFYGIQAAAWRACEQDGEVLIRLRSRLPADGLPVPLQLQLLEIDYLDTNRNYGGLNNNIVIEGIEYDLLNNVVAYWLFDQHPGDVTLRNGVRVMSHRVPAEKIIHLYRPARPGQGRGFSRFAPVITRTRDLQLYEDAELARKNLEQRLGVVVSGDATLMANPGLTTGGSTDPVGNAQQTGDLGSLPSGGVFQLPVGMSNMQFVQPTAVPGHVDHVRLQLHLIASGLGVPYEILTGDMSQVNFSSSRMRWMSFKRRVEADQWLTFIPRFMVPVWQAFAEAAFMAGKAPSLDYSVDFAVPRWDYVNPVDDLKADTAEVALGVASISDKIRARGDRPERVFAELASDIEQFKKTGILEVLLRMQKTHPDPAQSQQAASDTSATTP
jgi:lambda family phage portal protein